MFWIQRNLVWCVCECVRLKLVQNKTRLALCVGKNCVNACVCVARLKPLMATKTNHHICMNEMRTHTHAVQQGSWRKCGLIGWITINLIGLDRFILSPQFALNLIYPEECQTCSLKTHFIHFLLKTQFLLNTHKTFTYIWVNSLFLCLHFKFFFSI